MRRLLWGSIRSFRVLAGVISKVCLDHQNKIRGTSSALTLEPTVRESGPKFRVLANSSGSSWSACFCCANPCGSRHAEKPALLEFWVYLDPPRTLSPLIKKFKY